MIYKKYLILGLGAGASSLALGHLGSPLAGALGVLAFMLIMAWFENRALAQVDHFNDLVKDSGLDPDQVTEITGYSKEDLAVLKASSNRFIINEKDLARAIRALEAHRA